MKCSEIASLLWTAQECGVIRTNKQFSEKHKEYGNSLERLKEYLQLEIAKSKIAKEYHGKIMGIDERDFGCICVFDKEFPIINGSVKRDSDRPYLLFYKGDISLLGDIKKNVAVIGGLNPSPDILEREKKIVYQLSDELVIVSGLALGCDTVAHKTCLEISGKTIAILSTPVNGHIYPKENKGLSEAIVDKGGLLLSEYYKEAIGRESIFRLPVRDRLQAMFAKAVILIASYNDKNLGDVGSYHAIEAAERFVVERYVMYDPKTDKDNPQFGYNRDLYENGVKNITVHTINEIKHLPHLNIEKSYDRMGGYQQPSCF